MISLWIHIKDCYSIAVLILFTTALTADDRFDFLNRQWETNEFCGVNRIFTETIILRTEHEQIWIQNMPLFIK